jgi:hypothetical protein
MTSDEKLKTLKDLKHVGPCDMHIRKRDLRQEAIKRAKYNIEEQKKDKLYTAWWFIHQGRLEEIREFNNLTEEELK